MMGGSHSVLTVYGKDGAEIATKTTAQPGSFSAEELGEPCRDYPGARSYILTCDANSGLKCDNWEEKKLCPHDAKTKVSAYGNDYGRSPSPIVRESKEISHFKDDTIDSLPEADIWDACKNFGVMYVGMAPAVDGQPGLSMDVTPCPHDARTKLSFYGSGYGISGSHSASRRETREISHFKDATIDSVPSSELWHLCTEFGVMYVGMEPAAEGAGQPGLSMDVTPCWPCPKGLASKSWDAEVFANKEDCEQGAHTVATLRLSKPFVHGSNSDGTKELMRNLRLLWTPTDTESEARNTFYVTTRELLQLCKERGKFCTEERELGVDNHCAPVELSQSKEFKVSMAPDEKSQAAIGYELVDPELEAESFEYESDGIDREFIVSSERDDVVDIAAMDFDACH